MTAPRQDQGDLATDAGRHASAAAGRAELDRALERRSPAERSAFWSAVDRLYTFVETHSQGETMTPPAAGEPTPSKASASRAFTTFAGKVAKWAGHPLAFALGSATVVGWAVSGPFFGYSETWQLVINTGTTIVTFLMVFLIQNSQNRDGAAIQAKLDELIRASAAQNRYIGIENLTEEELDELRRRCETRAQAERLDNAREAADEAEARARDRAKAAAERVG
jgi:low affinity Fe/Cu permease